MNRLIAVSHTNTTNTHSIGSTWAKTNPRKKRITLSARPMRPPAPSMAFSFGLGSHVGNEHRATDGDDDEKQYPRLPRERHAQAGKRRYLAHPVEGRVEEGPPCAFGAGSPGNRSVQTIKDRAEKHNGRSGPEAAGSDHHRSTNDNQQADDGHRRGGDADSSKPLAQRFEKARNAGPNPHIDHVDEK